MNILLSSVGRRNYLVDYFKNALNGEGKVIAVNSVPNTSGMLAADEAILLPTASSEDYIDRLLTVCVENEVRLLFSLHDWEIPVIAANAERFKAIDVEVVMPPKDFIEVCLDKYATYQFCLKNGINTLVTYNNLDSCIEDINNGKIEFPLIIKPRWGQGSLSMIIANEKNELIHQFEKLKVSIKSDVSFYGSDQIEPLIIQEFLVADEYGVDIVNDLNGEHYCNFIKRKLAMRSGETDSAVTEYRSDIDELAQKIGETSKHKGVVDADFLVRNNKAYLLELNPRFGGGYPFSHIAGVDIPRAIIEWKKGNKDVKEHCNLKQSISGFKGIKMYAKEL